ncbi:PTS sugar transporter subunit IIA [Streptococcus halichoeri]|uniref:PTS sugar transporter subunit IIA n=1 Tax=Streptococcus halichoeri TaxID=254785 RepID=UPI000DB3AEAB|nr:PTS sugar transporter subunit IIA [Streptococcus halichoeri]PZO93750.1 MAG: PTS mannose transporter subunit IIA [Streptococcus pyogenes]
MKRKLLVASHGRLASGIQSSIEILAGCGQSLTVVDAYIDEHDHLQQIKDFVAGVADSEQGIIFSDLLGGSVNQQAATAVMSSGKDNIFLVTNANLATVLATIFCKPNEPLLESDLQTVIEESRVQLVNLSQPAAQEDDFFE